MKSMKKILYVSLLITTLSGCQGGYAVLYDSFPQSAMVVCNQKQKGYTPLTLYYNDEEIQNDRVKTEKCKAVWMSGVEKEYETDSLNITNNPKGTTIFVNRPKKSKDLSTDMLFDYQRKKDDAKERAQRIERIELINSIQNSIKKTHCNK